MPVPSIEAAVYATNRLIINELDYDTTLKTSRFESFVRGLNSDQYHAYRSALDTHNRGEGGLFFVYGSGGTGNIYLWSTLISKFQSEKHIVLAVASSGIVVLLLLEGKTALSLFKIPLQSDEMSVCYFDKKSERADLIRATTLIVWDEAPMMNRLTFKVVDRHLQDICDN